MELHEASRIPHAAILAGRAGGGCAGPCNPVRCVLHARHVESMAKQNITVALDKETVRKAKVLAAERGSSVSRVLSDQIEKLVGERDRYQAARTEAIAELRRGYRLGGGRLPRRDEIYER